MQPTLTLHFKDALLMTLAGTFFSLFFSLLRFALLDYSLIDGMIFGLLLGLSITVFTLSIIAFHIKVISPKIVPFLIRPLYLLFSFFAGFSASLLSFWVSCLFSIQTLPYVEEFPLITALSFGLFTAFASAMIHRFVLIRNEKEHLKALLLSSRLSSLETQLNPHFLFNALNSIAELVHQDALKAENAIVQLSTFLRNSMEEQALIPLEDELKNVHDYIAIENIRFNDSIVVSVINKEQVRLFLPKFSIQLLVENALKHGFKSITRSFHITITIESKHLIRVCDDGKAIESTRFGIGLSNLQERLHYLSQGDVYIASSEPACYEISLGGLR